MVKEAKITAEPGKQELYIEREFDAPRELVFRALTERELVEQWLGPKDLTCKVVTHAENGGEPWRFIHEDQDGNEYSFYGVVHEISPPERIIRTFEFEGMPEKGHVSMEILVLEPLAGDRTKMTVQAVFRSVADRDGMVQSGMERGVVDSHERLDAVLKGLRQAEKAN